MLSALLFLLRKYQIEIRRAIAIAVTPPTTPPAIAPVSEDEPPGLGDGLDGTEGLGSVPLVKESDDEVALEAALETEEEVVATTQQETIQLQFSLELETLSTKEYGKFTLLCPAEITLSSIAPSGA